MCRDKHLIVKAENGVVHRSIVQVDMYVLAVMEIAEVIERRLNPCRKSPSQPFFFIAMRAEDFGAWLVLHEQENVGCPLRWFESPLARWLSEVTGHVYGVDGDLYGRACWEACYWLPLPTWARLFVAWVESHTVLAMTGEQAFLLLARVEMALTPRRAA